MATNKQTASARIIAQNADSRTVTDAEGRKIDVRKLNLIDEMDLYKIAGPEDSKNEQYMLLPRIAYGVTAIDGVPVPTAQNMNVLRGTILRLGTNGMNAVAGAMNDMANEAKEALENAKNS